MPREIVLEYEGGVSRFSFERIERKQLYGVKQRLRLDPSGAPCIRSELTPDGAQLLRPGMLAQGYFLEDGAWISSRSLVALTEDGREAPYQAGTLGKAQELSEVDPQELLDHRIEMIYALQAIEQDEKLRVQLEEGTLFSFPFSYRGDYKGSRAFLLRNQTGLYALVGRGTTPRWCELESPPIDEPEEESFDDDLDFEMF